MFEEREKRDKELAKKLSNAREARTRTEKRQVKRKVSQTEWDDLALEERLTKKLRQGKISVAEYNRQLAGAEASEDDFGSDSDSDAPPRKRAKPDKAELRAVKTLTAATKRGKKKRRR